MFAIQNFGLLWERKYIHYGWKGAPGHLKGYRRGLKEADFRKQSGVYVLYDKDMIPIYVGQAGRGNANLFARLNQHEGDHLWNRWEYFSWFGLCRANKDGTLSMTDSPNRIVGGSITDALNDIEGVLILALEPKLNKQGPKFKGVLQFDQTIDDHVKDISLQEIDDRIGNVIDSLSKIEKIVSKKPKK